MPQVSVGQELLNVPFAEMISSVGIAIAEAQAALDENSLRMLEKMGEDGTVTIPNFKLLDDGSVVEDGELKTSMLGAGFQPTFYQYAETIIEVKMTMTATESSDNKVNRKGAYLNAGGLKLCASTVNATYTNKYNFTQEGCSTLRTRLVPIPPNTLIEQQLELKNQAFAQKLNSQK